MSVSSCPACPTPRPPKPARPDFLAVSSASIVAAACQRDLPVADALNKTVAGVGPVVCREAAWRVLGMKHFPVQVTGGIGGGGGPASGRHCRDADR